MGPMAVTAPVFRSTLESVELPQVVEEAYMIPLEPPLMPVHLCPLGGVAAPMTVVAPVAVLSECSWFDS